MIKLRLWRKTTDCGGANAWNNPVGSRALETFPGLHENSFQYLQARAKGIWFGIADFAFILGSPASVCSKNAWRRPEYLSKAAFMERHIL